MADLQVINVGTSPNDGQGDPLRTAFEKTNSNFSLLNAEIGNLSVNIDGAENTADIGFPIYAGIDGRKLEFKPLVPGAGIAISSTDTTVSISSTVALDLQGAAGSFVTSNGNGGLQLNSILVHDQETDTIVAFTDFDVSLNRIINVSNPINAQDVATKAYVDTISGGGGGGTGALIISKDNVLVGSARDLNFLGTGINVTQATSDRIDVSISAGTDTTTVQNIVGEMFTNNVSEGVITTYDDTGKKINLSVHDFAIKLEGDVTGSTTVSDFNNDVIIQTAAAFLKGLTVSYNGVDVGPQNSVTALNFTGSNLTVTRDHNTITLAVAEGLTNSDVRNEIGATVKGVISDPLDPAIVTESGITTHYVPGNNTLELGVRDFNIALTGAVRGNATVSRLRDIEIATTSDAITGLSIEKNSVLVSNPSAVKTLNFVGDNIVLTPDGPNITIAVSEGLTDKDVRNEIGATVKGVVSDPLNPVLVTESGITTRYVPNNNTLELGVRDFNIALSGAVRGNATVSRLQDINIVTTSDSITGLTVFKDGLQLSRPHEIQQLNFIGDNLSIATDSGTANISVISSVTGDQVSAVLNPRMLGKQDGLDISFDSLNKVYKYKLQPISIKLAGAVQGNGTITFDGTATDGNVTINTTTSGGGIGGITVADEGNTAGQATKINFVGGGITTSVSLDGQVATVYVPNSPAAEPFLTVTQGSENIPNARLLVAGTGITINDSGPGGDLTISANSDALLAKSAYSIDGNLVAEQFGINIVSTRWIIPIMENDIANNRVNLNIYYLKDAWYRQGSYDAGTIPDNEGPALDFGTIIGGILETQADLGLVTA